MATRRVEGADVNRRTLCGRPAAAAGTLEGSTRKGAQMGQTVAQFILRRLTEWGVTRVPVTVTR